MLEANSSSWHSKVNNVNDGEQCTVVMDGKGPIGKAKEEKSGGWEVGMSEVEEGGGGKVEQLYLNNSKKKKKKKKILTAQP